MAIEQTSDDLGTMRAEPGHIGVERQNKDEGSWSSRRRVNNNKMEKTIEIRERVLKVRCLKAKKLISG